MPGYTQTIFFYHAALNSFGLAKPLCLLMTIRVGIYNTILETLILHIHRHCKFVAF